MKVRYYVSLGYVGADKEIVVNIPDKEIENLSRDELDDYLWNRADEWVEEQIESGYEILKK